MNAATAAAATGTAVTVAATDGMTFPQIAGVLVFCIAIVVGCLLADAIFGRW